MDPELPTKNTPEQTRVEKQHREILPTSEGKETIINEDEKATLENNMNDKSNGNTNETPYKNGSPGDSIKNSTPEDKSNKNSNELSPDEEHALLNKGEMIDMFEKLAKESIQKITQGDQSDSSEDSNSKDGVEQLDKMIHSDPQKLILVNGHKNEQLEQQVESINKEIATEQEHEIEEKMNVVASHQSSDQLPYLNNKIDEQDQQSEQTLENGKEEEPELTQKQLKIEESKGVKDQSTNSDDEENKDQENGKSQHLEEDQIIDHPEAINGEPPL